MARCDMTLRDETDLLLIKKSNRNQKSFNHAIVWFIRINFLSRITPGLTHAGAGRAWTRICPLNSLSEHGYSMESGHSCRN